MTLLTGLQKLANVNFKIAQKPVCVQVIKFAQVIDHLIRNFSPHVLQSKERLVAIPGHFVYHNLVHKKGLHAKKKVNF